jgi:hypothetical protein
LHKDFAIEVRDPIASVGDGKLGEVNFIKSVIQYVPFNNSESADTLLHEVLHCLWRAFDLGLEDEEEHIVSVLATGLTTVMRDNPQLFPALQKIVDS